MEGTWPRTRTPRARSGGRSHQPEPRAGLARLLLVAAPRSSLLALLAPAACAAASPSPSASPLTYRIGLQSDVDNMNPFSTYKTIPWECFRVGYNFLTWYDADYKPVPDLADPVPTVANGGITDGGRVWTFHLRPNVKWSDGVPLTAHDVAYTYNRILRQKLGMYIGYFTGVTKVEAPDDATVVITSQQAQRGDDGALRADPARARLEQGARRQGRVVRATCRWSRAARSR